MLLQNYARAELTFATTADDYKKDVSQVAIYVSAVSRTTLPVLITTAPKDWDTYVATFVEVKSTAQSWTNNIVVPLLELPGEIANANAKIQRSLDEALRYAQLLIAKPDDPTLKADLIDALDALIYKYDSVIQSVQELLDQLAAFNSKLPGQAAKLTALAAAMTREAGVSQQQIKELQSTIDKAHAEIKGLTAAIVGLGIVDGVAIVLGAAAVLAAGPIGLLTWIPLGIAVVAATTFIVIDSLKIKALKEQIDATYGKMNSVTKDIAALNVSAANFTDLARQSIVLQNNLAQIIQAWSDIKAGIEAARHEAETAEVDASHNAWALVANDLDASRLIWARMVERAKELDVKLEGTNALIQLGDDEATVKAKYAANPPVGFVRYANSQFVNS